ncbi:MAG: sulfite exporter TauE/SafE family protein [Janthinobacterium lividum]
MTESFSLSIVLATTAVFLIAGVVKGIVGLGLPTVAMALLGLVMMPAQAAALLVMPSLVTNLLQLRPWSTLGPMLRRLGAMQVGICAGSLLGSWWLGAPMGQGAAVALGIVLIFYAVWGLLGVRPTVSARTEKWVGPMVGAATGVVTAATGVFVVPAVPYLQALGLEKDELVQAMGISFTVSTIALGLGLAAQGVFSGAAAASSLAMLVPAVAGMAFGQWLRGLLSPALFRTCFFVSLMLLGAHMVIRGSTA